MPRLRLDLIPSAAFQTLRRDSRSDAELLDRFLDYQDENAFEAIVARHSHALRSACRSWLRAPADIDDAVQATLLVFVQRARSIRNRCALGYWLYRVAANVARRHRQQIRPTCPLPENIAMDPTTASDGLSDLLHEVIARLPEKYRLPVQLCYITGLTTAEAAKRLGWPKGTVLTRLAAARERLQKCLVGRGVTPSILTALLIGTAAPAASEAWKRQTVRAGMAILAGESPERVGVSQVTWSLTKGMVRAMYIDRMKYIALAVLLAVGLIGLGIGRWASASNGGGDNADPRIDQRGIKDAKVNDVAEDAPKPAEARPAPATRRREAVIRMPTGTFVKEVDVAPHGSGRLTWIYEEDRVTGLIEISALGGEIELATESEISLSSTGTIYGLITSVRLNHLRLPEKEEFAEYKQFAGLWPAVEPLVNDMLIDLPFSYQFRIQGDRLVIRNFRILLAGPNPLGKLGGLAAGNDNLGGSLEILSYFQALATAMEGTYTAPAAKDKEKPASNKRSNLNFRDRNGAKSGK